MRFVLPIFLFCLISCQTQTLVPSEASMAAGMQLAKTRIVKRLRCCLQLPENGTELEHDERAPDQHQPGGRENPRDGAGVR